GICGSFSILKFSDEELVRRTAAFIAGGKIVGWFQGRAEWGPRALGNRSILVDPRRAEMKGVLNSRIKHREPFRPFAPSILEEAIDCFRRTKMDVLVIGDYLIEKPAGRGIENREVGSRESDLIPDSRFPIPERS